jgi:hypothetical protein
MKFLAASTSFSELGFTSSLLQANKKCRNKKPVTIALLIPAK